MVGSRLPSPARSSIFTNCSLRAAINAANASADDDTINMPMGDGVKLASSLPAFTNSNADFRIEGDDLVFDRIDFSGDAISLKGKGRMNSQRQIDLKFYPLVGREERQLAIFRPLIGQTGQELMLIEVTGTVDQPNITRTPFPRLDARLQQLFPELGRNESAMPAKPSGLSPREALNRIRPATWR